jgi:hypothetical protein
MSGLKFDDKMPKVISAKKHAIIDYVHVATNMVVAALFYRRNKRAGIGAFFLAGSVLANALMTDYEYGVFRLYSFKVHGLLDYGVAAASAVMPEILGISDDPEGRFFKLQGVGESLIAGITNYDDDSGARRTGSHRLDDRLGIRRAA